MVGINVIENYLAAFFTGLFTVFGVYLTQRYEEKRYKTLERKYIRDERKAAYLNLLSIAFQVTSKDAPVDYKEFYKRAFDNLAELSLMSSPDVGSKFMEIESRYLPLEGDDFYAFFAAIIKELSPLMYNEMNYGIETKSWWRLWR